MGDVGRHAARAISQAGGALIMAQQLEMFRSAPRFLTERVLGSRVPGLVSSPMAPLRLVNAKDPAPPADGWVRVRPRLAGICGSDLGTVSGTASFYFSPLVSLPFVLGHEVVGEVLDDCDDLAAGTRVVLEPVLSCATRGEPPCAACSAGNRGRCDRVATGHVAPGLQTGFCRDTGGGWSRMFVAHRSQLHAVPDGMLDRTAVLIEPLACAIHSALRATIEPNADVLVVGAGTLGILTLLALRELTRAGHITVVAKHAKQSELAEGLGASAVVGPDEAVNAVRRASHSMRLDPERGAAFLLGGVDLAIECAGSKGGLDLALRSTKAGGRVVLSAIPSVGVDLTPAWFRELELVGAYTGGTEALPDGPRSTFDLAIELAAQAPLHAVVGAEYSLANWRDAIDHALAAGRLGTSKVVFDALR
jgi:threonine dehydrogenase-like Zn-dependent dehydrogenase